MFFQSIGGFQKGWFLTRMTTKLRLLLITQYFPPETGAPQARLYELALGLIAQGWEVQVITAMPNYPKGVIHEGYRGKLMARETIDGIDVIRTAIYPTKSASLIPRLTNYFSFVFSSVLFGCFHVKRPTVLMVESPPLFLGLAGICYKFLLRTPLIMNISDLWPGTMVSMGMLQNGWKLRAAERLERMCYYFSDAVTGQSKEIIKGVADVNDHVPVIHIPNGCDCNFFGPEKHDPTFFEMHGFSGKTLVGYAGLIGLAQGMGIMIDLAIRFAENPNLMFVIVGDGPEKEKLEKRVRDEKLENIRFTGTVPKSDMPGIMSAFDMAMVPLRYVIPGAVPSKIYEAMASETPIVLLAQGEARDIVNAAGGGIAVDYENLDEVEAAIRSLANDPEYRKKLGALGRAYVIEHHHRPRIVEKLASTLTSLQAGDKLTSDIVTDSSS